MKLVNRPFEIIKGISTILIGGFHLIGAIICVEAILGVGELLVSAANDDLSDYGSFGLMILGPFAIAFLIIPIVSMVLDLALGIIMIASKNHVLSKVAAVIYAVIEVIFCVGTMLYWLVIISMDNIGGVASEATTKGLTSLFFNPFFGIVIIIWAILACVLTFVFNRKSKLEQV